MAPTEYFTLRTRSLLETKLRTWRYLARTKPHTLNTNRGTGEYTLQAMNIKSQEVENERNLLREKLGRLEKHELTLIEAAASGL